MIFFFLLQNCAHFQDEQLNRIDSDLMQVKRILVDINEPRRLCLQELGHEKLFVKWVKDALEGVCIGSVSIPKWSFRELSNRRFLASIRSTCQ